mmetsp:Transcript_8425/g.10062  ORF Transcript_8425/g.10062 Transcript_8425/m.10062 type:complete len:89 (-) Transcript_8425:23-289(-)
MGSSQSRNNENSHLYCRSCDKYMKKGEFGLFGKYHQQLNTQKCYDCGTNLDFQITITNDCHTTFENHSIKEALVILDDIPYAEAVLME